MALDTIALVRALELIREHLAQKGYRDIGRVLRNVLMASNPSTEAYYNLQRSKPYGKDKL